MQEINPDLVRLLSKGQFHAVHYQSPAKVRKRGPFGEANLQSHLMVQFQGAQSRVWKDYVPTGEGRHNEDASATQALRASCGLSGVWVTTTGRTMLDFPLRAGKSSVKRSIVFAEPYACELPSGEWRSFAAGEELPQELRDIALRASRKRDELNTLSLPLDGITVK